jgi:branched-chain amino acid transport system substrate-binding protein
MRQLRAAGVTTPIMGSESWDGDYWLEGVPNLSDMYFVTYASVFGNDPRPAMQEFLAKYQSKVGARAVTSHAVTGYSLIEAWTRAVTAAGSLDADKVREKLEAFNNEPLLAGPTTFTKDAHINMQRDLVLMKVDGGKTGNIVGIVAARQMPK